MEVQQLLICISCSNTLQGLQTKWCSQQCVDRERNQRPERIEKKRGYQRKYNQKPERKEVAKEYIQKPEVKERRIEYNQKPEVKEKNRERQQRPEYKKWKRERQQRPEYKEKERIRSRIRGQNPEEKEKRRERNQKPEVRARKNKNRNERLKNDLAFRIHQNCRGRIRGALRRWIDGNRIPKSASTEELLGCSFQEFIKHIENQFEEGMGWENWTIDGWHIDHIKPCFTFDLTKPEEQKECFNYTNQRPLWAKENMSRTYEELQTITQ